LKTIELKMIVLSGDPLCYQGLDLRTRP